MSPLESTLADVISINSVNSFYPGGPGEAEIANYVESFFRQIGVETFRQPVFPGRDNIIARVPGRSSRKIILEAHMDTVSVLGMSIAPFDPKIIGRRMHGRGACDTKAGLAAMMHAVADIHAAGITPECEIWLAAVVDEEYSFRGVVKLCDSLVHKPQHTASMPSNLSSDFPSKLHDKDISSETDMAIIAEPTGLRSVIASKGVLRWRMISRGVAAHSSKTHLGVNAISHMARVILALEEDQRQLSRGAGHPLLGPASCNVGRVEGGVQVNFVPDLCTIEIDRRLLPNESADTVLAHYQSMLDRIAGTDPSFAVTMEQPMLVDEALDTPADALVARIASEVLRAMKLDARPDGVPFGSDASKLSRAGIPSIIFGPGSIDQAHAAVEFVDLDEVALAHEFYYRFAQAAK